MKRDKIIVAVVFSVAILASVWVGGIYLNKARGHAKTVSVVGLAERDFVSDLIVWKFSYSVVNADLKAGYADIKKKNDVVRNYLKKKGITDDETVFYAIESSRETTYHWDREAQRGYETFSGYRLSQEVRIESNDVDKVEQISREVSDLLDEDIEMGYSNLSFYYTKLSELKVEMLAEATQDARNRAQTIAKNAGSHLGALQVANMGVFQITAPNSNDEDYSWGGTFNTSSKRKRASINMRLTYSVR